MDLGLPPYDNVYQATMRKAVLTFVRADAMYTGQAAMSLADFVREDILDREWIGLVALAVTNVLMVLTLLSHRIRRVSKRRLLAWLLCGQSVLLLGLGIGHVVTSAGFGSPLGAGYWVYAASYICVTAGVWMGARAQMAAGAQTPYR